ncbi:hypothetical protein VTH82DRAFT_3974 [Thermothelomyces myriococcoides]
MSATLLAVEPSQTVHDGDETVESTWTEGSRTGRRDRKLPRQSSLLKGAKIAPIGRKPPRALAKRSPPKDHRGTCQRLSLQANADAAQPAHPAKRLISPPSLITA